MTGDELATIKDKPDDVGPMHCARIKKDILCSAQKFDLIKRRFNDGKERIVLHE